MANSSFYPINSQNPLERMDLTLESIWLGRIVERLCDGCVQAYKATQDGERRAVWAELSAVFNVEGWQTSTWSESED